ncbi:MAG: hypothetical protein K2M88_09145 [Muribaculaceae bacterium]|nr:hypothetical protein [Muribaculaceae bacterium]
MKKAVLLLGMLCVLFSACSSDDEPESGLYDWDITKNVIIRQTGEIDNQEKEVLKNKSEDYVKKEKQKWESNSTKYMRFQYIYKRMK